MNELDGWIDIAKDCKYLPENDLKKLCDIVCDLLMEEPNIRPVSTPVTVCGDIHGQVGDQWILLYSLVTQPPLPCSSTTWKSCSGAVDLFRERITFLWAISWTEATTVWRP